MERGREPDVQGPLRRFNPVIVALVVLVALLVTFLVYAGTRNSDQDKLKDSQLTHAAASDPGKRCSAQATYDLIKRELFQHAARLRGSDQAAYDQIESAATLRMENAVMESQDKDTGAINCSGSLSLDLPPGVAADGGRTTLMSDIDYTIENAADSSGDVVVLRNADGIITPLATLSRTVQPEGAPSPDDETSAPDNGDNQADVPEAQPQPEQPVQTATPAPSGARPSFDCSAAHSRGEIAVCSDAGLAALDRTMTAQFRRALSNASPDEQTLLRRTGERFIAYRDRCSNRACIGDAYVGRMREIRDIMEGNWQPPR